MHRLKYTLPSVLLFGVSAAAADSFGESGSRVSSAKSASSAPAGAPVTLRGEIAQRQSAERYVFADNTGKVLVNVNDSTIRGPLETGAQVEIVGQVDDKPFGRTQVNARSVTVLASNSAPAAPDPVNQIHDGRNYQHFESD
jgi:uncharacterized protein (TIGR00156 family)